jgi:hypothetical protein
MLAAAAVVAAGTALVYPLESVAPAVSLGVAYIPGVLLVATVWGGAWGASRRWRAFGLAIAKGFAEANDGEIPVDSGPVEGPPGQGSTFVVSFPLAEETD